MAKARKRKVVFHRSRPITKIIILLAVVLSIMTLMLLAVKIHNQKQETERLRQQAIALEQETSYLQQLVDELDTIQSVIRIAKEKLGLVEPDSVIIKPE